MISFYKNTAVIYFITISVSLMVTCGGGYIQMRYVLEITNLKPVYFVAPVLLACVVGFLTARIIFLIQKLKMFSTRDSLTHAFNHGYYMRILSEWCLEKTTFSLIMIDIDHFKNINDQYGHQVGDRTLVRICEIVSETKRLYDVFARHGGEEFLILSPRTDLAEAADLAKRLGKVIREASMPFGHKLTCSFGVAEFREDSDTPDSIFERADKALYESKNNGRDRVTLETPAR